MSVISIDDALAQLNDDAGSIDEDELAIYVDAANEWVESRVADTSSAVVRLAALFLVDHWWTSQRGPASSPFGDEGVSVVTGRGFAIPNRVLELLAPQLQTATAMGSFPCAVAHPDPVEW